jgi:hypothetical protein
VLWLPLVGVCKPFWNDMCLLKPQFYLCTMYMLVYITFHFHIRNGSLILDIKNDKQWSGQTIQQSKWQTMIRTDDTTIKMTNNDQDRRYNNQNDKQWSGQTIKRLSFWLLYRLSWSLFVILTVVSSVLIIFCHFDCCIVCPDHCLSILLLKQSKWQTMIRTDYTTVKMTNNDQDRRYNNQNDKKWSGETIQQ